MKDIFEYIERNVEESIADIPTSGERWTCLGLDM